MSEQLSRAVAGEIRRLLNERGMSGNALAKATGMNQPTVARKLRGEHAFDVDDLAVICKALDVSVSDLMGWAERA